VDATSPVDEFISHLHDAISAEKIPFVVFVNKCDTVGAQPGAVRERFAGAAVKDVSSLDKKAARDALGAFIGTLRPHGPGA